MRGLDIKDEEEGTQAMDLSYEGGNETNSSSSSVRNFCFHWWIGV